MPSIDAEKEMLTLTSIPPFNNSATIETILYNLAAGNIKIQSTLRLWLQQQGLPASTVKSALLRSCCTAYTSKSYLYAWRKRTNPSWDLLGSDGYTNSIDNEPIAAPVTAPASQPLASTSPPASPAVTEKWLQDLYRQINTVVNKLVAQKLASTTLTLDAGAKQQIKQIAADAAEGKVLELMPPRQIEVVNHVNGTSTNVGLQHYKFPILLRATQAKDHRGSRLNIWLTGPTGSGKTTAAENAARALGLDFGSDGSLDADYKVLGFRDANGNIISTEFIRIYQNGGIYVADEIDNWMPSALLSLNAALANGWMTTPGGMIRRHPDACVIACANTWGLGATSDYVGRTRLDAASLDRFQPKIDWPYDETLERAVADATAGANGIKWFDIVRGARAKAKTQGLKIIISPRATYNGIALFNAGFEHGDVIDMTMAAGISPEQKRNIGLSDARLNWQAQPSPLSPVPTASPSPIPQPFGWRDNIDDLLRDNKLIEAIQVYRAVNGCSLYEAKLAVEAIRDGQSSSPWPTSTDSGSASGSYELDASL